MEFQALGAALAIAAICRVDPQVEALSPLWVLCHRFKDTIVNAKYGGHTEAVRRLLGQLPISAQSYSGSPYLDLSLFSYDDKWVSVMERPKTCGDHPIRYGSWGSPSCDSVQGCGVSSVCITAGGGVLLSLHRSSEPRLFHVGVWGCHCLHHRDACLRLIYLKGKLNIFNPLGQSQMARTRPAEVLRPPSACSPAVSRS